MTVGLLRAANPFCGHVTAPRHRTARAVEALARADVARTREANAVTAADLNARLAALKADAARRAR